MYSCLCNYAHLFAYISVYFYFDRKCCWREYKKEPMTSLARWGLNLSLFFSVLSPSALSSFISPSPSPSPSPSFPLFLPLSKCSSHNSSYFKHTWQGPLYVQHSLTPEAHFLCRPLEQQYLTQEICQSTSFRQVLSNVYENRLSPNS